MQGRGAGQVEGGKGKQSGHGTQAKGAGQEGLQGKGHGKAGLHGIRSKGHGAAGRRGKGQGKEGGHGYIGSPVFPGKGLGSAGGVVRPAVPPVVPPFPLPPYPVMGMMYPPPQRTGACWHRHTCSSARRLVAQRGGRREGREKSTGGHKRG